VSLLAVGLVSVSSLARASEEFPGVVQAELGMACPPPCTICHTSPAGGAATAEQPFAMNLFAAAAGMLVSESTLPGYLAALETNPCPEGGVCAAMPCTVCDIDGNGDGDIFELRNNKNPNNSVALECPIYGCSMASVAPENPKRRPIDGAAALVALGAAVALVRRVRR
jgi:MYXO-CTERM domain-containing protein